MSPVIVRTLVVPVSASLQLLHEALLVVFDWSGECLHEFVIRGVGYSSEWLVNGIDTRSTTLDSLGLRLGERLVWRYDFLADWVIDLRVEAVTPSDDAGARVVCSSGRRAGPPEWCRGVAEFFRWEDAHSVGEVLDCVDELRTGVDQFGAPVMRDGLVERLEALLVWAQRDRFEQAVVNRRLTALEVDSCVSSCRSG